MLEGIQVAKQLPKLLAQSICTHYSCFENMGLFATLKKIRSKIWVTKSFSKPYWTLFLKSQPLKNIRSTWKTRKVGADWLDEYLHEIQIQMRFRMALALLWPFFLCPHLSRWYHNIPLVHLEPPIIKIRRMTVLIW